VTLVGTRAVLKPPASPTANACNQGGVVTGICVLGHFDSSFNLVSRVHDVTIRGFAIAQFSGDGIFAFGARRFTAAHDVFRNNGGYGVFALDSIRTTYRGNTSHDNGDAGFYVGESPDANAVIVNNTSYNNTGEGILFRDSKVADIHGNVLFGNCVGILVLDTGVPGRAGFASIHDNVVANNNRLCPADSDHPAFGGIGIGLAGARFTGVHNNTVAGNHNRSDSAIHGGGLVLITAHPFGGANPVGNRLTFNHLVNDTPRVFWDHTGRNNVIAHNS
jgi:hypothetical protein